MGAHHGTAPRFSLHLGTHAHERGRDGFEHLFRDALRPPQTAAAAQELAANAVRARVRELVARFKLGEDGVAALSEQPRRGSAPGAD